MGSLRGMTPGAPSKPKACVRAETVELRKNGHGTRVGAGMLVREISNVNEKEAGGEKVCAPAGVGCIGHMSLWGRK